MRGDTLACVAHAGVYKKRLERIGARTACAVSALESVVVSTLITIELD